MIKNHKTVFKTSSRKRNSHEKRKKESLTLLYSPILYGKASSTRIEPFLVVNCYDVQSHLIISKPKLFFIFYINSWIYQLGKNETSNVNIEQLAI